MSGRKVCNLKMTASLIWWCFLEETWLADFLLPDFNHHSQISFETYTLWLVSKSKLLPSNYICLHCLVYNKGNPPEKRGQISLDIDIKYRYTCTNNKLVFKQISIQFQIRPLQKTISEKQSRNYIISGYDTIVFMCVIKWR